MKLVFEKSREGRVGWTPPESKVDAKINVHEKMFRQKIDLPELGEIDVIRHYTALSRMNYGVDTGFYPLGSCTMKYNPKVNERACRLPGFCSIHPHQSQESVQGALELMYNLEKDLCELTGMHKFSLQPAAGAHGELTGIMIIKAHFMDKKESRHKILIPDSAHGTNPASAAFCGYQVVSVNSNQRGCVDLKHLESRMDEEVAGLMLTNPNTLGLFEENIHRITDIVHAKGGKVYYDGANMNAILGKCRPGDMGYDVVHLNLHKTFSTPHGGGGPGSGPVGVSKELEPYLPKPTIEIRKRGKQYHYCLDYKRPKSIGRVRSHFGNFGVMVRAYAYIKALGGSGLKEVAENAVLNANYLMKKLKEDYYLPFDRACMHEFVLSGRDQVYGSGVHTTDISKRILDYGMHAPTIYFPLIVEEALMIEPTETESKDTLDEFAEVMKKIAQECKTNPSVVKKAPQNTPVKRLDNTLAARNPDLRFAWHT